MDKEEAMAALRAAYSGEGLTEDDLRRMLANSMAQDDSVCGFAVEPRRDCPHVGQLPATAAAAASAKCGGLLTAGCEMCGDTSENWVCLATGRLLCSRYVAGHMKAHAEGRAREPDNGGGVVALSLSDLSAWCFQCDSYITDPVVEAVLEEFRCAKFGSGSGSTS